MKAEELKQIIDNHKLWLNGEGGKRANLRCANLIGANLRCANLSDANLRCANLRCADLIGAVLIGADLSGAYLSGAKMDTIAERRLSIVPETGPFHAWKKASGGELVKLEIPEDAARSNATERKCRASHVRVLAIFKNGKVMPADYVAITVAHGPRTEYKAGEIVRADKWDDNRWNECSHGIHFFLTREEALAW